MASLADAVAEAQPQVVHWQLWQVHSLSKQQPQPASHCPQGQVLASLAAAGQASAFGQTAWLQTAVPTAAAEQQLPTPASADSLQQLCSAEQQLCSAAQQLDSAEQPAAAALLHAVAHVSERLAAEY